MCRAIQMHWRRRRFGRNVSTVVCMAVACCSIAFATNEIVTEQFCIGACVYIIQFRVVCCTARALLAISLSRKTIFRQDQVFFSRFSVSCRHVLFRRTQRTVRFNKILIKIQKAQDIQFKLRTTDATSVSFSTTCECALLPTAASTFFGRL